MPRILVVEDDRAILMGLVRNLEFEGYEVQAATTGEEGLRLAAMRNARARLTEECREGVAAFLDKRKPQWDPTREEES